MASVDNATRVFSNLSDLVLAEFLSKDGFEFPLNDAIKRKLAAGRDDFEKFELQMRAYAALDDALMERYAMVPWLAKTPIDCEYCEGFFSVALDRSVFGSHQRGELTTVASLVFRKAWQKLIQSLLQARFSTTNALLRPDYYALSDLLSSLMHALKIDGDDAIAVHNAILLLNDWWAQREELSSEMTPSDQVQFLRWLATEKLPDLHRPK